MVFVEEVIPCSALVVSSRIVFCDTLMNSVVGEQVLGGVSEEQAAESEARRCEDNAEEGKEENVLGESEAGSESEAPDDLLAKATRETEVWRMMLRTGTLGGSIVRVRQ